MPVEAHFYKNRCLFNNFDQHTDLNPYSRKPGVNYYRFNFIGALQAKIGFAQKIDCRLNSKPGSIYLNKKSFQKWIKRHQNDRGLNSGDLNEARVAKSWERVIELICKNVVEAQAPKKINSKPYPLPTKKVLEKAENEFALHPFKYEILARIKNRLSEFKYDEKLASRRPITLVFDWADNLWGGSDAGLNEDQKAVIRTTTHFLAKLPGIIAMKLL